MTDTPPPPPFTTFEIVVYDCLIHILSHVGCEHEYQRFARVSKRWRNACAHASERSLCVYTHDLVEGSPSSTTCCVHCVENGVELVNTYLKLMRCLSTERPVCRGVRRALCLQTPSTFLHFKDETQRLRFVSFIKQTLGLQICVGGTCCGGKGMKFHAVFREGRPVTCPLCLLK